jgi:thiamine biosynthesis lipoprotein
MNSTLVLNEFRRKTRLMGSAFEFIVTDDSVTGDAIIDQAINEVKRIEFLLTEFSDSSVTSAINKTAWQSPISIDAEVYEILARCKAISKITQGAFDITSGVLKKLYNFKGADFKMPDEVTINDALKKVGSEKIELLDSNRVHLKARGMHIAFGAIGKGYAADRVKKILMKKNVPGGVINASGDLTVWGTRPDGSPWKVGIADPNDPARTIAWIPMKDSSIATSGNYEQFFEHNGKRYSHNIDPLSGKPVSGIKSVSVVSPSAELSDALATAVNIMGVDVGLHFIEQLPATHCLIIDDRDKIFTSRHLRISTESES